MCRWLAVLNYKLKACYHFPPSRCLQQPARSSGGMNSKEGEGALSCILITH